ncbi:nucleotide exchange factor GrpE [Desertivirga xinjiangensis]|uniref:nucleotide exchange factor GrpE n=1 Tax=Desertivirga xinjiangensis TaxID=539206 RepID=UPI002108B069|nr:nucleotide exchange factor GrpE [Pedobacter xinjiangensis]
MLKNKKKAQEESQENPENKTDTKMNQEQEEVRDAVTDSTETEIKTEEPANQPSEEEKLRAELSEANDKYLRLYAEFDNYKRRTTRERVELLQTAGKEVIVSLLPTIDDFERALKSMETTTDVAAVKEGVNLVHNKLKNTLIQKGLKEMEAKGSVFDAEIHEAITNIPAPSEDLKGKVIDEVEKGYYLNDKVIRFAKVIVGS